MSQIKEDDELRGQVQYGWQDKGRKRWEPPRAGGFQEMWSSQQLRKTPWKQGETAKSNTGGKRKDGGENRLRLGAPGNAN